MKSLLSLNSYHYRRGGSDVVYLDHAELFESKGWSNTFFSMNHPRNIPTKDDGHFIDLVDFEYAGKGFSKLNTVIRTVYNKQAKVKLKQLLNKKSFSIAHVHCIYHHLTPAIFKELHNAGIPIVITAHDLKVACPAYKMMNKNGVCEQCKSGNFLNLIRNKCIKGSTLASTIIAFEAYFYAYFDTYKKYVSHIIAPSKFYRDKIVEWGYDPAKVSYIPNFTKVIPTKFKSGYDGRIVYFGRLSEEKGLETLIRAAAISGVSVDIIGTGPTHNQLLHLIKLTKSPVRLLGRLDGDALWQTIGSSRAVVIPSEWYENAPMSVLESFQLERPIIGANIGGIPELVSPNNIMGECGWLFESGNPDELARILKSVTDIGSTELLEKGKAGRNLALGRFSKEQYYESILEVYSELTE